MSTAMPAPKKFITGIMTRSANLSFQIHPATNYLRAAKVGGKSTAGVIKTLNRLRRGMSGIMGSPDLEHFKKSLWPEFKDWCPIECVIERQQYRLKEGWEPSKAFTLVFHNEVGGYSRLVCGGFKESEVTSWEGPNVNFSLFDEARRHDTPKALKVLDGRCRIPGPNGEPPQLYFTTTPKKHWLYEYFGGARGDIGTSLLENDPHAAFKSDAFVATVLTQENEDAGNLESGFTRKRAQSLTASEIRVNLGAAWEDESDVEKFVNIFWWDACAEQLPPLSRSEPAILALDAAIGSETTSMLADCFAAIIVSRHPTRPDTTAVRYCGIWQAEVGKYLDFEPIEAELYRLCNDYSIIEAPYDITQLHDMAQRMRKNGINAKVFSQQQARLVADKDLQADIMARRIAHDGNPLLRQHIDNADIKKTSEGIRIVKRSQSLKVDACVSLAMARARLSYFNL